MSEEPSAISRISPAPAAQSDYDSICAALMQTERGRWFLEEYARRNRSADTRILLAAIQRIEAVVGAERSRQAQQGFRTDLLEMAQAIIRTRAEVDEIPSDSALRPQAAGLDGEAEPPPRTRDVFAAAERIRDVTWAMRGHGFDPTTCDQLEELAASILAATSLRDPTDRRASKLSEVLQYLEHRIETLMVGTRDGEAAAAAPRPSSHAALPAPAAGSGARHRAPRPHDPARAGCRLPRGGRRDPATGFSPRAVRRPRRSRRRHRGAATPGGGDRAAAEPPPARELEAAAGPAEPIPAVPADVLTAEAIDLPATDAGPEPLAAEAVERQAEESVSPRIQEVEAQAAELTSASEPGVWRAARNRHLLVRRSRACSCVEPPARYTGCAQRAGRAGRSSAGGAALHHAGGSHRERSPIRAGDGSGRPYGWRGSAFAGCGFDLRYSVAAGLLRLPACSGGARAGALHDRARSRRSGLGRPRPARTGSPASLPGRPATRSRRGHVGLANRDAETHGGGRIARRSGARRPGAGVAGRSNAATSPLRSPGGPQGDVARELIAPCSAWRKAEVVTPPGDGTARRPHCRRRAPPPRSFPGPRSCSPSGPRARPPRPARPPA